MKSVFCHKRIYFIFSLCINIFITPVIFSAASDEEDPKGKGEDHSQKKIDQIIQECRSMSIESAKHAPHDAGCTVSKKNISEKTEDIKQRVRECTGKADMWKFCHEMSGHMVRDIGVPTVATYLASKCAPVLFGGGGSRAKNVQMATTTLATAFTTTINSAWQSWQNCGITTIEALKKIDMEMRNEEDDKIKEFPQDLKSKIFDNYQQLDALYQARFDDEIQEKILFRELRLIQTPYKSIDISKNSIHLDLQTKGYINEELEKIISDYKPIENDIRTLVNKIRNVSSSQIPYKKGTRIQNYFYGPAGTGKTTFVQRLADLFGLYVCRLNYSDFLGQEEHLFGREWNENNKFGKIGTCYIEANHTNFIIFIDELGDHLTASPESGDVAASLNHSNFMENFKKILDPDKKEVLIDGLGLSLDFSKVTVIASGNSSMKNDAMLSRMSQIVFPTLTPEQKAIVFQKGYQNALTYLIQSNSLEKYTDIEKVKAWVDSEIEYIIEQDKDFPGGRVLKEVLMDLFTSLAHDAESGKKLSKEDIQSRILGFFKKRKPISD